MRRRCEVRLAPIDEPWARAFVAAALRAVERWPFGPDGLTFGTDRPVLRLRLVRGEHLAPHSRYEGDTDGLLDVRPAPRGFVTVRSWSPVELAAVATNVVAADDLATAQVELIPGTLSCTAFYHAAGASPALTDLLWLRARIDVDLSATAVVRATVSNALVSMTLVASDAEVEVDLRSPWWARPLLDLALAYVRRSLRRRYGAELDGTISFEQVVQMIAEAWNDAVPGLVSQSPDRLADELLDGAIFRA